MKHTVFITGAAGYVGGMLVERFAARDDVERIIGLDVEPFPEAFAGIGKLVYLCANTVDPDAWRQEVERYNPDIVIHTAWRIRLVYGKPEETWRWNVDGSNEVFDFTFTAPSVKRFIHFSSVGSYAPYPTNTLEQRFTEEDPLRPSDYMYVEEKRIVEVHLKENYDATKARGTVPEVVVVRPAAITGPRGRILRTRFGLQSTLSGQMKGSIWYDMVSAMVSRVPATPKWARQFIHEDDVTDSIERLAFGPSVGAYEVFNLCPPGRPVLAKDMAKAVGKKVLPVAPWMVRIAYFVFWHLTRGKIPTTTGSWKGYSYPTLVDGSKLTRVAGYTYKHDGYDAFYYTRGYYEQFVPEEKRRNK